MSQVRKRAVKRVVICLVVLLAVCAGAGIFIKMRADQKEQ